jgi:hypothetical protein
MKVATTAVVLAMASAGAWAMEMAVELDERSAVA